MVPPRYFHLPAVYLELLIPKLCMFLPSQSNIPMLCFWSPKTWPINIMLKYPVSFLRITFFHLRSSYCHKLFKQIYLLIHFKICSLSKLCFTPRCLLYRITSLTHANPVREFIVVCVNWLWPGYSFLPLQVSGYSLCSMSECTTTRFRAEIFTASTVRVTVVCYRENEAC
jgi:hypothetical protein